jgi:RNA-directed DNA polymerase
MIAGEDGERKLVKLVYASDTPIQRHTKIKGEANPFDPAWEQYFEERLSLTMKDNLRGRTKLLYLWSAQKGKCPSCGEAISKETGWNVHHILEKARGGSDAMSNLVLLHPNCHRQIHGREVGALPAPVKRGFAEA